MKNNANDWKQALYDEVWQACGKKVVAGGNMSKKQFCELVVNEVVGGNNIFPIDFSDIVTVLEHSHEVDAASLTAPVQDFSATLESAVEIIAKHHPETKIRRIIVSICQNDSDPLTPESGMSYSDAMRDFMDQSDIDFMWVIATCNDVDPGACRVAIVAGMNYDVTQEMYRVKFSRSLAHLLRHTGEIDSHGFCHVSLAMRRCGITFEELRYVVEHDDKNRFEIVGDTFYDARIRARNGHSRKVDVDPGLEVKCPPQILYHGTTPKALEGILGKDKGLLPMSRKFVQLTENPEVAIEAAKRHMDDKTSDPVLLEVHAHDAFLSGVEFNVTTNGVWQCLSVPPRFIHISDSSAPHDMISE